MQVKCGKNKRDLEVRDREATKRKERMYLMES
jgi:hypothetical protein